MKQIYRIAFAQLLMMLLAVTGARAQETFWRQLEYPYGGNVFFFITAPNGTIYTGTERNGMFRSTDEGATWTQFGPADAGDIYPTLVTPDGAIFIATDDRGGIFRTTDDGATWAQTAQGALTIRPGFMARTPAGTIIMATDSGIYRSTNNGALWSHAGLADTSIRFPAVAPNGTLFAAGNDDGLFRSTDDGLTWLGVGSMNDHPADAILFIDDREMIVGTDDGIFRSIDNGDSFTPFALAGMQIGPLALGRLPGGDLVTATPDSGLYRLSPDGATVTHIPAAPGDNLYGLAVTPSGNIVLGYEGRGILLSTDEGASFRAVGVPHGFDVSSLAEGPDGRIYAGGYRSGLYRSTDGESAWEDLGLRSAARYLGFTSPSSIFVAGAQGEAWQSSDNGATWTRIVLDIQSDFSGLEVVGPTTVVMSSNEGIARTTDNGATWTRALNGENVYAMAQSPNGDLSGVGYSKIFHSTDDGATWTETELSGTDVEFRNFFTIASPANGVLLMGTNMGDTVVILRSTNSGRSWSRVAPIGCNDYGVTLFPGSAGVVFAGTSCGIYRSVDAGANWSLYAPLPENERNGLFLADGRGGLWFGGTHGIYTAEQPSAVPAERDRSGNALSLSLYPNPADGRASVAFTLASAEHVTLSIRTLLGETVATIHDGRLDAGAHTIGIDRTLPAGSYLLELRAGDRSGSIMMQIVK
jgi:photosystem II stability/assembly factor-like uncharacterized protein